MTSLVTARIYWEALGETVTKRSIGWTVGAINGRKRSAESSTRAGAALLDKPRRDHPSSRQVISISCLRQRMSESVDNRFLDTLKQTCFAVECLGNVPIPVSSPAELQKLVAVSMDRRCEIKFLKEYFEKHYSRFYTPLLLASQLRFIFRWT